MKKGLCMFLIVCLALVSLIGCGANKTADEGENKAEGGTLQSLISPDEEYIIVNCLNNIEYFNAHKWGWQKAGEMFGVKTSFVGPMDGDTNAMVAAFDSAISRSPAGICVWGWDPGLTPSVEKAMDAGIPVVTYVGDLPDSNRLTYIGSSQYDIGYIGAKQYAEYIGGEGKVAIMTLPGNPMFEERAQGFEDGFAEFAGIEIVAYGDTKADTVTSISAAKDIINKYQDLKGFVCTDSTGAIGASTAVKEMNMLGKIDILGMDRNSDVLDMIKDGIITGSLVQNDVSMPYWAMFSLITAKHFDVPLTSDNAAAGVKAAPNYIYTSVNMVTIDNVDYYLAQNELYAEAQ